MIVAAQVTVKVGSATQSLDELALAYKGQVDFGEACVPFVQCLPIRALLCMTLLTAPACGRLLVHPATVLIDHWKDRYLPDGKQLVASGLLSRGAVIFADNIIFPGALCASRWAFAPAEPLGPLSTSVRSTTLCVCVS